MEEIKFQSDQEDDDEVYEVDDHVSDDQTHLVLLMLEFDQSCVEFRLIFAPLGLLSCHWHFWKNIFNF